MTAETVTPVPVMCSHGIVCVVGGMNGRILLHPQHMDVCEDSRVPIARIKPVDPPTTIRGDGADAVVSHHEVVRDGSVWWCRRCGATRPFGQGAAEFTGECVRRPLGAER